MLLILVSFIGCQNHHDIHPKYTNPDVYNFQIDNDGLHYIFTASIDFSIVNLIAERGFYYGHTEDIHNATKIIAENTTNKHEFSAEITLNDYGTTYYVTPYISNGTKEIYAETQTIVIKEFAEYISFSTNPHIEISKDGYTANAKYIYITSAADLCITEKGIIYIDNTNTNTITTEGIRIASDKDYFEIPNLKLGTTYSYCMYATDGNNSAYSDIYEFESIGYPEVETSEVQPNIESVYCRGTLISDGGNSCTCGFVWSEYDHTPVRGYANCFDCEASINGNIFETDLQLKLDTQYYIRAYCKNSRGTSYGAVHPIRTQKGRYISLSCSELYFDADGDILGDILTNTIDIESSISWEFDEYDKWIEINQITGESGKHQLTISVSKNNSILPRSCNLILRDKENESNYNTLKVTQNGIDVVYNEHIEFDWHINSEIFKTPFPQEWNAETSTNWINLSAFSGNGEYNLEISVEKNISADSRYGHITFSTEGETFDLTICQVGQYLKLSPVDIISASKNEIKIVVETNVGKSMIIENIDPLNNWISFDETTDGYLLHIDYNPSINSRRATYTVMATDEHANTDYLNGVKYEITQSGRNIQCSTTQLAFKSANQISEPYSVTADGKYTITKGIDDLWYNIYPNYDDNTFYVELSDNASQHSREGVITLSLVDLPTGESLNIDIPITQSGRNGNIDLGDWGEDENWDL